MQLMFSPTPGSCLDSLGSKYVRGRKYLNTVSLGKLLKQ